MAIAAIMVAILAAIFNMVAKTHKKFWSAPMLQLQRKLIFRVFLEECDRDQCDFKMAIILAVIFKMATKMRKISKCSYFNENWYVGLFPHEECDSDKSDLKMASYLRLIL